MSELFAAIDVGSYELAMKIFELSSRRGVRELDFIRHRLDLGSETYAEGRLSSAHLHELIRVLGEYRRIMDTYGVKKYRACGTSALREAQNADIIREQLQQMAGIRVDIVSNSEQRFLDYKAAALRSDAFLTFIEKPTAILDIGGGSLQISFLDKDKLVATQNLHMGVLRLYQTLTYLQATPARYEELISEIVNAQLSVLKKLYLKDRSIQQLIVIDDYVSPVLQRLPSYGPDRGHMTVEAFTGFLRRAFEMDPLTASRTLGIPEENVPLVRVSSAITQCILSQTGAETVWAPGVTLCDGIAYEYAEKRKLLKSRHDFEQDIIACAQNISKRFLGSKKRSETLQSLALRLYDSLKKLHGLSKRERLLLQLCAILHDCGKYISMTNLGECCYNIIMSTEIIGLSHAEREIVANVVRFNHVPFEYFYENSARYANLDYTAYLTIVKLTAILRIANGLDRTHLQKFRNVDVHLKDSELVLTVETAEDITVERGLIAARAAFFEEVYAVTPVIRQKRQQ